MPKSKNNGDKAVNVELPAALVGDLRNAVKRWTPHRTKTIVGAAIAAFLTVGDEQVDELVRRYISEYVRRREEAA